DHGRVVKFPSSATRNFSQKECRLPLPVMPGQFPEAFDVFSCRNQHTVVSSVHRFDDGLVPVGKSGSQSAIFDGEMGHMKKVSCPDHDECEHESRSGLAPVPFQGR